jgi:hypothetical protein
MNSCNTGFSRETLCAIDALSRESVCFGAEEARSVGLRLHHSVKDFEEPRKLSVNVDT